MKATQESKCNEYLRNTLQTRFTAEEVKSTLELNTLSLATETCLLGVKVAIDSLDQCKNTIIPLLTQIKGKAQRISSAQGPIHRMLTDMGALEFQFKHLSGCYTTLAAKHPSLSSSRDSFNADWWEATGYYLKFVKRSLMSAKKENPPDQYMLANLNRNLLTAMLSGMS